MSGQAPAMTSTPCASHNATASSDTAPGPPIPRNSHTRGTPRWMHSFTTSGAFSRFTMTITPSTSPGTDATSPKDGVPSTDVQLGLTTTPSRPRSLSARQTVRPKLFGLSDAPTTTRCRWARKASACLWSIITTTSTRPYGTVGGDGRAEGPEEVAGYGHGPEAESGRRHSDARPSGV